MKSTIFSQVVLVALASTVIAKELKGYSGWELKGTTVSATMEDEKTKAQVSYTVDLNDCAINNNGKLNPANKKALKADQTATNSGLSEEFSKSCTNLALTTASPPSLTYSCTNAKKDAVTGSVELTELIHDKKGKFECKSDDKATETSSKMRRGAHMVAI